MFSADFWILASFISVMLLIYFLLRDKIKIAISASKREMNYDIRKALEDLQNAKKLHAEAKISEHHALKKIEDIKKEAESKAEKILEDIKIKADKYKISKTHSIRLYINHAKKQKEIKIKELIMNFVLMRAEKILTQDKAKLQ